MGRSKIQGTGSEGRTELQGCGGQGSEACAQAPGADSGEEDEGDLQEGPLDLGSGCGGLWQATAGPSHKEPKSQGCRIKDTANMF